MTLESPILPPLKPLFEQTPPSHTPFVVYGDEGRIHWVGTCAAEHAHLQAPEGLRMLPQKADHATDWVDLSGPEPQVAARPAMAATLETRPDGFTVSGLPQPCTVIVRSVVLGSEESWTVEDGVFAYDDVPGAYHIRIEAFPFLDRKIEVTL